MSLQRLKPNAMMLAMQEVYTKKLEHTAQNLAHANTIGFKAFRTQIREARSVSNGKRSPYVGIDSVRRSRSSGSVTMTKNPYDLAITGRGYFGVQTNDGIKYTRNGQFRLDPNGFLIDSQGNFLLNIDQTPIQLPLNAKWFVSSKGSITINGRPAGTLGVFDFEDDQKLKPVGYNLSETDQEANQSTSFSLTQGAVEESNVSIMHEAINLITIQRNFEYSQKLMEEYDQQQRKINQINQRNA